MALTWGLAEHVPALQYRDAVLLNDFGKLDSFRVDQLAKFLLHLLDPLDYTLWAILIVATALLRGRTRLAIAVAVVLPAAPGAAELLKPLLAHPHYSVGWQAVGPVSWPSGHATAAMTLALCAVLVAPRGLRPLVALAGAAFVAAVGCALLILAWHMPSDVLGGYLLATLCVALAVAALGRGWDQPGRLGVQDAAGVVDQGAGAAPCAPGSQSDSDSVSLAARARMKSRSESRLR